MGRGRTLALVVLAIACSNAGPGPGDLTPETWTTCVPPVYLDAIRDRCALSRIESLHEDAIPSGSVEVRAWGGFGLQATLPGGHELEGLVLRHDGEASSGTHYPRAPGANSVTPASGWPAFWSAVRRAGLYELPDCRAIDGWTDVLDGIVYVVEIRYGERYRSYHYDNPRMQDLPEAARFLRLLQVLREETGFERTP